MIIFLFSSQLTQFFFFTTYFIEHPNFRFHFFIFIIVIFSTTWFTIYCYSIILCLRCFFYLVRKYSTNEKLISQWQYYWCKIYIFSEETTNPSGTKHPELVPVWPKQINIKLSIYNDFLFLALLACNLLTT